MSPPPFEDRSMIIFVFPAAFASEINISITDWNPTKKLGAKERVLSTATSEYAGPSRK